LIKVEFKIYLRFLEPMTDRAAGGTLCETITIRRNIAADPISHQTVKAFAQWQDRCTSKDGTVHTLRSLSEESFMPARLIELQRAVSGVCLQLVEFNKARAKNDVKYAALSYRWGCDQKNQLTKSNHESHLEKTSWQNLLKTPKDAVTTTYRLGLSCLWIDSFSFSRIMKRTNTEISRMTKVYTHSYFAIMARRSETADHGFLGPIVLPSGTSRLQYQVTDGRSDWITPTFQSALESEDCNTFGSRGWVLQEHMLSRRLIMFGSWFTEWSCRTERSETSNTRKRRINVDGWTFSAKVTEAPNFDGD
jgi:hypothetical protein